MAGSVTHASSVVLGNMTSASGKTRSPMRRGTHDVHALLPTVVRTKSLEKVTTVGSESIGEVFSTSHDVVTLVTSQVDSGVIDDDEGPDDTHDILAVTTRSIATLVVSQLHETLFAITTNGAGVAATLLEGDRSQEDGGNWQSEMNDQPSISYIVTPTGGKKAKTYDHTVGRIA